MNETPASPPVIPEMQQSTVYMPAPQHREPPLGSDPGEQVPITNLLSAFEAILRQPRRVMYQLGQAGQGKVMGALVIIVIACSLIYGLVVGTFSGGEQLWAAPVKVCGGLLISALICLPSLYIFSCLSGSSARLIEVFGLLAGFVALMTVLMIGFAPVAWVFSQSTESVAAMGTLHLAFWWIATAFGARFLWRGFAQLKATKNGSLGVWFIIFALVALQMTTALRPIVGTSTTFLPTEKRFFLTHWSKCLSASETSRSPQATERD